jgi:signal transduction histidine kinase
VRVRVGTRITATTSVIVAVALIGYAFFSIRSQQDERRTRLIAEARDQAFNMRETIQSQGVDDVLARAREITADLAESGSGWRVSILDASLVNEQPPEQAAQVERLRTLIDLRLKEITFDLEDEYVIMVRLTVPAADSVDGLEYVGAVEVSRPTTELARQWRNDLLRSGVTIALIMAVLILVIVWTTRIVVGGPISKLIAGIDDVAQGALARVLVSARDDERGALASRFNEMTFSLRESQAETDRQNQTKLSLEQRLSETARLATMGQMAAEIAHEVGTPLNVISGRARNLGKKADDRDAVAKNATIIAEQAGRITRIIQRLLDFTRRKVGAVDSEGVNVNAVTLSTMEFLEGQLAKARVKHTLARAEGLPLVQGNPDQLQQVFLNLFLNAVQAMPDGGRLRVETALVERKRPGLEAAPQGRYVQVTVTDSGVGIPIDAREKIFEPFYTSKEREGGTGLGLAVCQGIIKEHDGWIEIDDAPGGGTVFSIFLPAAE